MNLMQRISRLWHLAGCTHPIHRQFNLQAQHSEICLCSQCGRVIWIHTRGRLHEVDPASAGDNVPVEIWTNERLPMEG